MIRMVRFDCGCVGLYPENGMTMIIEDCREGEVFIGMKTRSCSEKKYVELSPEEVDILLSKLRDVLEWGYKYRELRNVIRQLVEK